MCRATNSSPSYLVGEQGETIETSATVHDRLLWREGEELVVARNAASADTAEGQACRYQAVFVVVNGDLRVDRLRLTCAEG